MPVLTPATRVAARPDVLSSSVGDEGAVLLDPRGGVYLGVEGTAALLWTLLARGPASLGDLCDAVEADYDVSRATCERDVHAFVTDLLQRDLVMVVTDADGGSHEA